MKANFCFYQTFNFQGVTVVTTQSVHSSLHSVGGIQMLLPLFYQIDLPHLLTDDSRDVDYSTWLVAWCILVLIFIMDQVKS